MLEIIFTDCTCRRCCCSMPDMLPLDIEPLVLLPEPLVLPDPEVPLPVVPVLEPLLVPDPLVPDDPLLLFDPLMSIVPVTWTCWPT